MASPDLPDEWSSLLSYEPYTRMREPKIMGASTHETDDSLRRRLLYVTGDPGVLGMSPASLDALAANLDLRRRTREELDMEIRIQLRWMEHELVGKLYPTESLVARPGLPPDLHTSYYNPSTNAVAGVIHNVVITGSVSP